MYYLLTFDTPYSERMGNYSELKQEIARLTQDQINSRISERVSISDEGREFLKQLLEVNC